MKKIVINKQEEIDYDSMTEREKMIYDAAVDKYLNRGIVIGSAVVIICQIILYVL